MRWMPHYDQATRMLGVVTNPTFTDADRILKEVADDMGVGDTFVPTPVGVFFGEDGQKTPGKTVPDPYFGGEEGFAKVYGMLDEALEHIPLKKS